MTNKGTRVQGSFIHFHNFIIKEMYSLSKYIQSGLRVNLNLAIDYTASNGEPSDPGSLHFINAYNPQVMNQYESAIFSVGNILLQYDADQLVPTFGYGGVPSYSVDRKVSHCFSLNGSPDAVIAGGVGAILATY